MNLIHKLYFKNCGDAAIALYQKVFGVQIRSLVYYRDAVANGWEPPCPEKNDFVYHCELLFGEQEVRLDDGASPELLALNRQIERLVGMDSEAEVKRAFALLAEGGEVLQPLEYPPYMVVMGTVRDRFGVPWKLMCDFPSKET